MTDATEKSEQSKATVENGEDKGKPGRFSSISIAEWLAIGGVLIIAISFAWEWGYWSFFGLSLVEIPMLIENLTSVVFAWMPLFLVTAMTLFTTFLWVLPHLHDWVKVSKATDEVKKSEQGILIRAVDVLSPAFFIIGIGGLLLFGSSFVFPALTEIFPYSECLFAIFAYTMLRFFRMHFFIVQVIFCVGMLMWVAFSAARFSASEDIVYASCASIEIKVNGEFMKKEMLVLRSSQDFIYAYSSANKKLSILPWRLIERISYDVEVDAPVRTFSIFQRNKDKDENEIPVRPLSGTPTPRH